MLWPFLFKYFKHRNTETKKQRNKEEKKSDAKSRRKERMKINKRIKFTIKGHHLADEQISIMTIFYFFSKVLFFSGLGCYLHFFSPFAKKSLMMIFRTRNCQLIILSWYVPRISIRGFVRPTFYWSVHSCLFLLNLSVYLAIKLM